MPIVTMEQLYNYQNVPRSRDLFQEIKNPASEYTPIFSLSNNPPSGLIPLKKLYIAHCVDDPTEVTFVDEVFGDWNFWEAMCKNSAFPPYLENWRREVAIRRKQKAFKKILEELEDGKNSFQAAKYLIEEPWMGGPTAADRKKQRLKTKETSEEAYKSSQIQDDISRLRESGVLN
jgi:hypothetical protein